MGWKLIRVRGRSMAPTLLDGDYVLIRHCAPGRLSIGDIVVLHRPGQLRLIKRLGRAADAGGYHLSGDGIASQPSVDLGTVLVEQIEGRAVMRIRGASLKLLARRPLQAGCLSSNW